MFSTGYYQIDWNDGSSWHDGFGYLEVQAQTTDPGSDPYHPLKFHSSASGRWPLPSLNQGEKYRFTGLSDASGWPAQKGSGEMCESSWQPMPEEECDNYEPNAQFGPGPVEIVVDGKLILVGLIEQTKDGYEGTFGVKNGRSFPLIIDIGESAEVVLGDAVTADHVACLSDEEFEGRENWHDEGTLETYSIP